MHCLSDILRNIINVYTLNLKKYIYISLLLVKHAALMVTIYCFYHSLFCVRFIYFYVLVGVSPGCIVMLIHIGSAKGGFVLPGTTILLYLSNTSS